MSDPLDNPYSALAIHASRRDAPTPRAETPVARASWWTSPLALAVVAAIALYRLLYPVAWRRRCIYSPTCSAYGLAAVKKLGAVRGIVAIASRIRRCNGTLYRGGHDPI